METLYSVYTTIYLKVNNQKQGSKINYTSSSYSAIKWGVTQDSILRPLHLNFTSAIHFSKIMKTYGYGL